MKQHNKLLYDPLSQMRFQFLRPTFRTTTQKIHELLLEQEKNMVTQKNLLNVRFILNVFFFRKKATKEDEEKTIFFE